MSAPEMAYFTDECEFDCWVACKGDKECLEACLKSCERLAYEGDVNYVDPEADEYCSELCYDIGLEEAGLCDGDDCIDMECYERCIKTTTTIHRVVK